MVVDPPGSPDVPERCRMTKPATVNLTKATPTVSLDKHGVTSD
jgi:hypothetical protein